MKNIINHTNILITVIYFCFNAIACSTNDEIDSNSPEDNLPEETKAFLGYWESSNDNYLFFADGICWRIPYNSYNPNNFTPEKGYWTYDNSTKILATTINQWQVTLSNPLAWTGISLVNEKVETFEKVTAPLDYIHPILTSSSWEESPDSVLNIEYLEYRHDYNPPEYRYTSDFEGYRIGYSINLNSAKYIEILEDNNTEDYIFKYNLREFEYKRSGGTDIWTGEWDLFSTEIIGSGTVELKNPKNYSELELVFTGSINKTMHRTE